MLMTYEHPWYVEQQKLGNITDSDAQSQQKQKLETLGQIRTLNIKIGEAD